jgi:hypothetical protein
MEHEQALKVTALLEGEGFDVVLPPLEFQAHDLCLFASNSTTGEAYSIRTDELGLILHYGRAYFNPHGYRLPKHKDKTNPNRIKHYAESVLARVVVEVQSAKPGARNAALYRAACTMGRFLFGWNLNPDSVQAQLLDAALTSGLRGGEHEARATIRSGFKAGQKKPKDPSTVLSQEAVVV